ncbi:MAG TPA: lactate utilization protein [Terriglobia bacterium]|nr:lactate utilization protein [Terriglobia bacterium]
MLAQIRQALARPGTSGANLGAMPPELPIGRMLGVMPPIAPEELLPKFEAELAKVSGVAHRVSSLEQLDEVLRGILTAAKAESVILSRNPLLPQLKLGDRMRAMGITVTEWPTAGEPSMEVQAAYRAACFSAAVGITGADWALAETGSLVVTSQTEGSQLASLAPPVHIALYTPEQLVESLDDILERLPLAQNPLDPAAGRSVVFVTGVSRTADIEQILIRGVHGPRELHAVLIESACLSSAPK